MATAFPIVTSSGSTVYVALGTGGGQFGPAQSYPVSGSPAFIAVGDFDDARKPDLAVAGISGVQILLNNGNGTLGPIHKIRDISLNWLAALQSHRRLLTDHSYNKRRIYGPRPRKDFPYE